MQKNDCFFLNILVKNTAALPINLPGGALSTPKVPVVVMKTPSPARKQSKKRRNTKYINDGKIDTETLREGKAKTDKIFNGGQQVIKDAATLHNTTGAAVKVFVWRMNDCGTIRIYESPNFKGFTPVKLLKKPKLLTINENEVAADFPAAPSDETAPVDQMFTPSPNQSTGHRAPSTTDKSFGTSSSSSCSTSNSKTIKKKRNKRDQCQICKVWDGTPADDLVYSSWIRCGKNGCEWWVHCKCVHVFYRSRNRDSMEEWSRKHFRCPKHMANDSSSEESGDEDDDIDIQVSSDKVRKHIKKAIEDKKNKKKE